MNQAQAPSGQAFVGHSSEPRLNGLAIASLCVSLIGLVAVLGSVLLGPIGAILGHKALGQIKRAPSAYRNRGMALAGVIIGWIAAALGIIELFMLSRPAEFAHLVNAIF